MPRQPRLDAPGTLHHVMGRGIERAKIFRSKTDREDFLQRVAQLCEEGAWLVYGWALLSNHFHLLARTCKRSLSWSMRKLLTGYVINFNRRHSRRGHLFQNRYKSIVCEDDPYLLELTRYIHLNPIRAGIVKDIESLSGYPWSGHSCLMGKVKRLWQETDTVLAYFGNRRKEAIAGYESFVREGVDRGRRPELVGGGLIRSVGGWSQVLSLRRHGMRVPSDDRILGSGDFVGQLLEEVDERERATLRLRREIKSLDVLCKGIARDEWITEMELRSGGRSRKVRRARQLSCKLAVAKMGYAGAEVARFLGVTTSAVAKAANRDDGRDLSDLEGNASPYGNYVP